MIMPQRERCVCCCGLCALFVFNALKETGREGTGRGERRRGGKGLQSVVDWLHKENKSRRRGLYHKGWMK